MSTRDESVKKYVNGERDTLDWAVVNSCCITDNLIMYMYICIHFTVLVKIVLRVYTKRKPREDITTHHTNLGYGHFWEYHVKLSQFECALHTHRVERSHCVL